MKRFLRALNEVLHVRAWNRRQMIQVGWRGLGMLENYGEVGMDQRREALTAVGVGA